MSDSTIKLVLITDVADSIDEMQKMLAAAPELEVVGTAATSEEGVALATAREPDVVVMDYDMPGLDGAEATRAILHEDPSIQVIMLSLVNEADDIRHAMRAGARDYLVKPLGANELVETVRWLIRERREYARMTAFVKQLRKAYDALFWDDKPVPPKVVAFLEAQVAEKPHDRLTLETLAVAYARNRNWAKLAPVAARLTQMTENHGQPTGESG
jgi:DNA-binding NarL/FixJ family response regulator